MPKKFAVNGVNFWVDGADFADVCQILKENVVLDNPENFECEAEMEKYSAKTFIDKSRYYLSLNPPDLFKSAEKAWYSAVCAVKELFLTAAYVDIKSHKGLSYFTDFALYSSRDSIPFPQRYFLRNNCWESVERLHQDLYDSPTYELSDYSTLINNIETFVTTFANLDRQHLSSEFKKTFIIESVANVDLRKADGYTKLGGLDYKREYVVIV
ncbi:unnamed protein product [Auanema sp. JU1783]|nr:unnamed protein product [Auanema sp. JU1783]